MFIFFCIEGEKEADWLRDVGFDNLIETFQQGREIPESELNASISFLSKQQAEAVKRRVRSLNQTIRNGYRQQRSRPRKPDIRDVFRDMEVINLKKLFPHYACNSFINII